MKSLKFICVNNIYFVLQISITKMLQIVYHDKPGYEPQKYYKSAYKLFNLQENRFENLHLILAVYMSIHTASKGQAADQLHLLEKRLF